MLISLFFCDLLWCVLHLSMSTQKIYKKLHFIFYSFYEKTPAKPFLYRGFHLFLLSNNVFLFQIKLIYFYSSSAFFPLFSSHPCMTSYSSHLCGATFFKSTLSAKVSPFFIIFLQYGHLRKWSLPARG